MNQEQAINILLQVAKVAQSKGVLLLEEAAIVAQAVSILTPKQEEVAPQETQELEAPKTKAKK